jgi:hypothetical protein
MKKIILASVCGLFLAGCNATVYDSRPVLYTAQRHPIVVPHTYTPLPPPRPQYIRHHRRDCFTTWDRTPYGIRERVICR